MESISNEHINKRVQDLMSLIRSRPEYLSDEDAIQVLAKAAINGNHILKETSNETVKSEVVGASALCDYAQFLLDFSYAVELKIVNDEFPESCKDHKEQLIGYLDEILYLLKPSHESGGSSESHKTKSKMKELLECVYWRKGALMYMHCNTAINNQSQFLTTESQKRTFLTNARDGVTSLVFDMRQLRHEETTQEYAASDEQVTLLIKQGIFSDVHMLGLMYAAEMCYWINIIGQNDDLVITMTFNPQTLGKQLVRQYIMVAEGPLKEAKWNTGQAMKISKFFS